MKSKQIVFTKPTVTEFLDYEVPEPKENEVMIETMFTTISCGTERANLMDMPNVGGEFPRISGYNCCGVVVKKGENVTKVEIGDRVIGWWSCHRKYNVLPEKQVVKLEDENISFQTGAMSFISTFPLAAIRKTKLEMGESAMVMGLGILGTIAVKLLRVAGATPIIAVDPNLDRRKVALENGADYAFDPFEEDFANKVKAVTDGGVKVAIEVTGVGAGLDEALDCMAKFGRVALLGCTRYSDFSINFYKKVHVPGISLIGAHTIARPEEESYPGYFTHNDDIKAILKLCSSGRLVLENLIQEVHKPEECAKVYDRLMNDKNFPIVSQFDWRNIK